MRYPKLTIALALVFSLFTLGNGQAGEQQQGSNQASESEQSESSAASSSSQSSSSNEGSSSEGSSAEQDADAPQLEGRDALATQVALAVKQFSPGVLDGLWGQNTRDALTAFQKANDLEPSGELDEATKQALGLDGFVPLRQVTLSEEDVAGPFVDEIPPSLPEQAKLEALRYTSVKEKVAEKMHVTPELLDELNPEAELAAGATLWVPKIPESLDTAPASELTIRVAEKDQTLRLEGPDGIEFFAPVTAGSKASPLPIGEWKVIGIATDPTFSYDPSLFADAPSDHEKATLPPGPNNPVGVVWIDLDKEHYGIHGTPEPSKIGYTESHGCVRLTNWDAMMLAERVAPGTKVVFEE